jgi:hypothetical protein
MAGLAWEEYMLEAVDIPPLSPNEERHLLAVAINDLYKTLDIIVEHAEEFLSSLRKETMASCISSRCEPV